MLDSTEKFQWAIPSLFFFIFVLDSNPGRVVSEATTQSTVPQPLQELRIVDIVSILQILTHSDQWPLNTNIPLRV